MFPSIDSPKNAMDMYPGKGGCGRLAAYRLLSRAFCLEMRSKIAANLTAGIWLGLFT